jgi:hypothetical protein
MEKGFQHLPTARVMENFDVFPRSIPASRNVASPFSSGYYGYVKPVFPVCQQACSCSFIYPSLEEKEKQAGDNQGRKIMKAERNSRKRKSRFP